MAAENKNLEAVFDRINEIHDKLSDGLTSLRASVERQTATCEPCRKVVMGNGKNEPADRRLTRLETKSAMRLWVDRLIVTVGASTITAFVVGWLPRILHWW